MQKKIHKSHKDLNRPPFKTIALLLQGGGSLGAYQGGVYQALTEANIQPDWIAGTSIGAFNGAIIAGNPPEKRVKKLRKFWEYITTKYIPDDVGFLIPNALQKGELSRRYWQELSAIFTTFQGVRGLFIPRFPTPWLQPIGTPGATSYYDNAELRETLKHFVDFDRINSGEIRFSVCAVNLVSGNSVYFDTRTHHITVDHLMAAGALPPGFPPVEIEGEQYWDGGIISNTPLQWVLEEVDCEDTLIFQVDLWSARGKAPRNMIEVMTRQKEIQYSSRTRSNTDRFKEIQKLRYAAAKILDSLPEKLKNTPETEFLKSVAIRKIYNIVHLIYRAKTYEGPSKDYEFSRLSMEEHWNAGYYDTIHTLRHPEILERQEGREPVLTFDFIKDGSD